MLRWAWAGRWVAAGVLCASPALASEPVAPPEPAPAVPRSDLPRDTTADPIDRVLEPSRPTSEPSPNGPTSASYNYYPTLGFDANAVYISTNNTSAGNETVTSIPKSDLNAATPTVANRTSVNSYRGPGLAGGRGGPAFRLRGAGREADGLLSVEDYRAGAGHDGNR